MSASASRPGVRRAGSADPDGVLAVQILSAMMLPVLVLNAENGFRHANPAAEEFLGISVVQLKQINLADLLPADHPLFMLISHVRQAGVTVSDHDLNLQSPRLAKRGISVQASPLPEEEGAVIMVFQDTSGVRALDRQLAFRGAVRSVSGMAAILAHEVKNPLSGIRGAAQLLEASVGPSDRELATLIQDEVDRIRDLVDRMEMFDEKPIECRPVNIHRVLEHVRKLAQSGFAANIRFTEVYDPSLPPVSANRDQLVQVLLNLVKNAAEAISASDNPHGEIILSTAYQHGVRLALPGSRTRVDLPLLVIVRDNGPGIAEDILPHLFEPFVTSKSFGSGLGLALVAKIIGDHGGLAEVQSRPGRTEFHLHLPMALDDDPSS
ncbi:MAG: PAS domain-containing protein [Acetobacteraceae bacterium]|nr:PAS domain-containing protein [Acetobacteraceae bacterium]